MADGPDIRLSSVAIVGRANVGKSSLFNALCRERVAIVDPTPGITRDRIAREVTLNNRTVELVDTGGVGMESAQEIAEDVEMQIEIAIAQADLVLLVVDAQEGLQPMDSDIAQRLRQAGKRALVVANKAENQRDAQGAVEFYQLGLGEPVRTSASHRSGISALTDQILEALPEAEEVPPHPESLRIAFIGRRNVGKSTLINYLAQEPRVVVSEVPGTTRDSVDVRFQMDGLDFVAIDTAGVRKKKQLSESVDFYSQVRTQQAIQRADVAVHIMEAPNEIGRVDKQLADQVIASFKPCVIAVNKMDLAPPGAQKQFRNYFWSHIPGLRFAPLVFITAQDGSNVRELLDAAQELDRQSDVRVSTSDLNTAMTDITNRRRPPSKGNRPGNVLYATQVSVRPPTIALFVNDSTRLTDAYRRYVCNQLRKRLPFPHIPIQLVLRRRSKASQENGEGQ